MTIVWKAEWEEDEHPRNAQGEFESTDDASSASDPLNEILNDSTPRAIDNAAGEDAFNVAADRQDAALTSKQQSALMGWLGKDQPEISDQLRNGSLDDQTKSLVNNLDAAFRSNAFALTQDATLFRGVGGDASKLMPGSIIQDKSFSATSASESVATDYGFMNRDRSAESPRTSTYVMEISAPAGTKYLVGDTSDRELVLNRDTLIVIDKVDMENKQGELNIPKVYAHIESTTVKSEWEESEHPRNAEGEFESTDDHPRGEVRPSMSESEREQATAKAKEAIEKGLASIDSQITASSCKEEVARDIANRIGEEHNEKLIALAMKEWGPYDRRIMTTGEAVWQFSPDGTSLYYVKGLSPGYLPQEAFDKGKYILGSDPRVSQQLKEDGVSSLVSQWAISSNDANSTSLAIQEAAVREFGLPKQLEWDPATAVALDRDLANAEEGRRIYGASFDKDVKRLSDSIVRETKNNGSMYQAFLRAQYENTQAFFKASGVTEIPLSRGVKFQGRVIDDKYVFISDAPAWAKSLDPKSQTAIEVDVPSRPLSSFAYSDKVSKSFAGDLSRGDRQGFVMSGIVPVDRILSCARSGVGCLKETEVVVMAGAGKLTVKDAKWD